MDINMVFHKIEKLGRKMRLLLQGNISIEKFDLLLDIAHVFQLFLRLRRILDPYNFLNIINFNTNYLLNL